MIKRFFIIFTIFFYGCSYKQTKPPDLTVAVDSLMNVKKFDTAIIVARSLLSVTNNDSLRAELFMRYAACKEVVNESDSSIFFYNLSLDMWRSRSDTDHIVTTLTCLGYNYAANRNYKEATQNFSAGLKLSSNKSDSIDIYNGICFTYINQKNFDAVYATIKNHFLKYEKEMTAEQSYYIFFGQGLYLNSIKKYDSALIYLQKALYPTIDNPHKGNTYTNIANVYKSKRNFAVAFNYLDSAKSLYQNEGSDENKQFDYDTYREIYDSLGNYRQAYYYAQLYRNLSDSIYDAENKNAMINAAADSKTIEERSKTKLAQADSALKKWSLIFTVIALALVFFLAVVAFRNTRIKQKANQLLTLQKQQVQQLADQLAVANDTKARLFSTIGHDLRSPVSSLYASLKMQELKGKGVGDGMSEQTVRLLDTLEELLIWSKSQMDGFTVQPVKINIQYFFEDLKKFYSTAAIAKNITIINEAARDTIIRTDENLLKTIFRNAISNAIANTTNGSTIQLTAQPTDNSTICLTIINPCDEEPFRKFKSSFDEAIVKSGAYGLGVVLMKEFAQKLGAHINLSYTGGSANVSLCVPTCFIITINNILPLTAILLSESGRLLI